MCVCVRHYCPRPSLQMNVPVMTQGSGTGLSLLRVFASRHQQAGGCLRCGINDKLIISLIPGGRVAYPQALGYWLDCVFKLHVQACSCVSGGAANGLTVDSRLAVFVNYLLTVCCQSLSRLFKWRTWRLGAGYARTDTQRQTHTQAHRYTSIPHTHTHTHMHKDTCIYHTHPTNTYTHQI